MADEEKKVTEEGTGEKKEGKISGFFKKIGKKLDDATYDMRLQSEFDKSHAKYTVYSGPSSLSISPEIAVEEHLDEGYLLTLDDDEEIAEGNLIANEKGEVVHIVAVEDAKLTVNFEGADVEKDAKKIVLGEPAVKVEVIKVGKEFYLK